VPPPPPLPAAEGPLRRCLALEPHGGVFVQHLMVAVVGDGVGSEWS
jgi:hypothetical protein